MRETVVGKIGVPFFNWVLGTLRKRRPHSDGAQVRNMFESMILDQDDDVFRLSELLSVVR